MTSSTAHRRLTHAPWWPFALLACEPLLPPDVEGTGGNAAEAVPIVQQPEEGTGTPEEGTGSSSPFAQLWILASGLNSGVPPAVGQNGVSYLDIGSSGQVSVTFADWSGALSSWYRNAPGYFAEVAAHAERHLALLYRPNQYGIYDRGGSAELSLSPTTYKESLAVNSSGFGWIDYGELGADGSPTALSSVVFQTWDGVRRVLTDAIRYRSELDASETHLAYVEYPDTSDSALGQVMVASLDGSAIFAVAPSLHHQDHPALDGDWVVWEEFASPSTTIIRAASLTTRTPQSLTDAAAFRTQPDVRGPFVTWEDHRSGNGDIYRFDLGEMARAVEELVVGGSSHSTAPRLLDGGLLWLESHSDRTELRLGLWATAP